MRDMGILLQTEEEPTVVTEEDQRAAKWRQARWKLQVLFACHSSFTRKPAWRGMGQKGQREVRGL